MSTRRAGLSRRDFIKVSGGAVAGVLALAGCGRGIGAGGEGDTYTIRLVHELTPQTVKGITANKFKELLEERTEGRITVEVSPNGELYGGDELTQAIQSGGAEMSIIASADFVQIAPELQALDLPFLIEDLSEIPEITAPDTALGKLLYENDNLAENNIQALGVYSSGIKQLSTNTDTRTLEDMKGQRVRVQQSPVLLDQYRTWGAAPVQIADFGEVYTGLEQGVIDGQENPYSTIYGESVYEVQDFIAELSQGYVGYLGVMNSDFLDSLPDDLQQAVNEVARETSEFNQGIAADESEKAKQKILEESSTEIIEFTAEEKRPFIEAVVPSVWNESADVVGRDVIDELLSRG